MTTTANRPRRLLTSKRRVVRPWSAQEAARYLCVSRQKLYALVQSGTIPCTKKTGRLFFDPEAIIDFIEKNEDDE